ncbi:flagellar biogenesis protein FliO [Bradyrhizobium diazoefficiens]
MSPDNVVTVLVMLANVALAIAAIRIVWWLFKRFVSGTGKAWRGEL